MSYEMRATATQPQETRDCAMEVRVDAETGRFEGYASAFGVIDSYGDVMEPGCFLASLATWKQRGQRVPILWQHDYKQPIGYADTEEMVEDERGLHVVGHLVQGVRQAEEARLLMAAGATGGLSIGFTVRTAEKKKAPDGVMRRHITALDLYEFSPVTWPANGGAVITDVRQQEKRGLFSEELADEDRRDALHRRRWQIEGVTWKLCIQALRDQSVEQAQRLALVEAVLQEAAVEWLAWFTEFAEVYAEELAEERSAALELLTRNALGPTDTLAGKVLSASNRAKVQAACDALTALLAAADASEEKGVPTQEIASPPLDQEVDARIIQELRDAAALQQLQAALRSRR